MAAVALLCSMGVFTGCNEDTEICDICESMTDPHDGRVYKTIKIGNQTWTAENMDVLMDDSWCYEDKLENCKKYGRLYKWDAAKAACPEGWRLPSKEDFEELFSVVGSQSIAGKKLKSKAGWKKSGNGEGGFFFKALPGGIRLDEGKFLNEGNYAYFWTSTEFGEGSAYNMYLDQGSGSAFVYDDFKFNGRSVRCVKNE